ncbi:MAG: hypothetical protein LGL72_14815 [Acidibrevibacterium sp.]|jgi:type IV secretion system protein VirB10|uniref:hypothetical protein n=1 Tax=Acidibrevibacterium fodinaquatile TaxID=1969806 RepID=UPI0023A7AC9A|nr:hypothetical protein [Acidibrevibacterium fodinaquatile]MCA7120628.1 hypothetical protein [Acidibrevibacterium fodinaquatile]
MTEAPRDEERAPPRPPQEMRLRAQRAPVTRLSRKVLLGLAGLVGLGIGGAAFLALRPRPRITNSPSSTVPPISAP